MAPENAAAGFTRRLRGALGLAAAEGGRPKPTSATTHPLPISALFRGRHVDDRSGTTQLQQGRRRSVSWADDQPGDNDDDTFCPQATPERWSHGANAAGDGPAALARSLQSPAADARMDDARLNCAAPPSNEDWRPVFHPSHGAAARARDVTGCDALDAPGVLTSPVPNLQRSVANGTLANAQDAGTAVEDLDWTLASCRQHAEAARVRDEAGSPAQFADGVLPMLPPHPQQSTGQEPTATAHDAGISQFANLEWTPGLDAPHAADASVRTATGGPSHVADVLAGPAAVARRSQIAPANATLADATDAASLSDFPSGMAAVFFDRGDHDQVVWRPVVVVDVATARETVRSSKLEGLLPVFTGTELRWVDPEQLEALTVTPEAWSRLRSHFEASPPPTPSPTPGDQQWAWLTPTGLGAAVSRAFALPRHAVPHVVGRGGSLIRKIESILGLIVGVVDGGEGGSTVTVFGPEGRVDWARPVIECVARGGRSILCHLEKMPFD